MTQSSFFALEELKSHLSLDRIGGVIANSSVCGSEFVVNVGCGLNLDNAAPTLCINHLIQESGLTGNIAKEDYFAAGLWINPPLLRIP
jgi:hypothetical protein